MGDAKRRREFRDSVPHWKQQLIGAILDPKMQTPMGVLGHLVAELEAAPEFAAMGTAIRATVEAEFARTAALEPKPEVMQ